jgi:predicted house-cleaning NTP pyrophosphatase (Maf/HAM1 superfamily)
VAAIPGVMGLPLFETAELLQEFGYSPLTSILTFQHG